MANTLYDALFAPHEGKTTPFLHMPDGAVISHAAFLETVGRMSNALKSLNVDPGDRVAVHVEKSAQALALYAACVKSGVVFLPLNTGYTPAELAYFVDDSKPALFVCDPVEAEALAAIAADAECTLHTMGSYGEGSFFDLALEFSPVSDSAPRDAKDIAALLYTSGTTGRSKGRC